jgi:hypothetical protein
MTEEEMDERYRGIARAALAPARELPRFRELEPEIAARLKQTPFETIARDGAVTTMLRIYQELSTK